MVRNFDLMFQELIDESIPKVMLTSKDNKNNKNSGCTSENIFVREYCEEY